MEAQRGKVTSCVPTTVSETGLEANVLIPPQSNGYMFLWGAYYVHLASCLNPIAAIVVISNIAGALSGCCTLPYSLCMHYFI